MIRDTRISHHTPLEALIFQRMNYEWNLYLLLLIETYLMIMMYMHVYAVVMRIAVSKKMQHKTTVKKKRSDTVSRFFKKALNEV